MKTIVLILSLTVLAGGCSTNVNGGGSTEAVPTPTSATTDTATNEPSSAPIDPFTPEMLDTAVRAAAQQLIDSSGIEGTMLGYDEDGELRVTFWTDWRANGDVASVRVDKQGPSGRVEANDTAMLLGSHTVGGNVVPVETWTTVEPSLLDPAASSAWLGVDLVAMAAGSSLEGLADVAADHIVVNSEPISDGGTRWRMVVPLGDGTVTREWLIDGSGYLQGWSWAIGPGMVVASDSRVELQFTPIADPDPIVLPEVGTELDPGSLGFPEDLPTPSP